MDLENQNITVLVVDDRMDFRKITVMHIHHEYPSFQIIEAVNGVDACDKSQKHKPDMIIMDWEMPVMDGVEAIKIIKKNPITQYIPVIMATAFTSSEKLKIALDAGAVDYLRKPIDKIELIARINSMLNLSIAYRKLLEQNQKIEFQNSKIVDSINYAKRIQDAVTPPISLFEGIFSDFIIINRPRDIVSGDFYWLKISDGHTFIVLGDCTGHGVPGGFMSMIGVHLLNTIIVEKKNSNPGEILDLINQQIIQALRQDETEVQDGMEMLICRIDQNNSGFEIVYSGAKLPLYYHTKNESQIQKLSPDRRSIGGFSFFQAKEFENHTLNLNLGDKLFFFSDGLSDQNNFENKRLSSRKVIELLQETKHLKMNEIKNILENRLSQWQGNEEQRDDIMFIGVKL